MGRINSPYSATYIMKKYFCKLTLYILAFGWCFFSCSEPVQGQHGVFSTIIKYPREIDLTPFEPLQTESVGEWSHSPRDEGYMVTLQRPGFFGNKGTLTIQSYTAQGGNSSIRLIWDGGYIVWFAAYNGVLRRPLSAYFFDFDGNGLLDVKLVFCGSGNSGNANNAYVYYLLQFTTDWQLISYFLRDESYSWECDIDGDGKYELLKGHHQDKRKPGYFDSNKKEWVGECFRKYLFINAYRLTDNGLRLCNDLSDALPIVLCFQDTDAFDIMNDKEFLEYNQFRFPDSYVFQAERIWH